MMKIGGKVVAFEIVSHTGQQYASKRYITRDRFVL